MTDDELYSSEELDDLVEQLDEIELERAARERPLTGPWHRQLEQLDEDLDGAILPYQPHERPGGK